MVPVPQPPVRLRDVHEEDLIIFYLHQREPDAVRMAAFEPREREEFIAHWKKILRDPNVVAKTIFYGPDVAGNIVSWAQEGQRLVGYWIGQDFWNRGIATRALKLFLDVVRQRPLYAYVACRNVGSQLVLEKCGFRFAERDLRDDGVEEELWALE